MPGNIFRTAVRSIRKGGLFSFINVIGLALGLSVCLLIVLFVTEEFSYDRYNEKADRIFRIVYDVHLNSNSLIGNFAPFPMGPAMVREYPPIENAVRIRYQGDILVRKGSEKEIESRAVFADAALFKVFTLPLVAGDPSTALSEPHTMVISEHTAKKYFNSTEVLGKTLVTEEESSDTSTYKITGVMKDIPAASHFHFDLIKSMAEKKPRPGEQWINPYCTTYLLAKPGVTAKDIDRMLAATVAKYVSPQLQQKNKSNLEDMAMHGDYFREYCIPLTRIHLYSHVSREFEPNGNSGTVIIFIIIALFILFVACTNFVNLSTARSADRSKEVGVRKLLGASRRELIAGFLVEAVLTSGIALFLAILITVLLLPYFSELSGKDFHPDVLGKKWILLALVVSPLAVGGLAGSYPAFYLSASKPLQVLKGRLARGFKSGWFRNSLVIFQFATTIALIIGTLVIYSQLHYIRSRDPGFNREQVLTINNTNSLGNQARLFREAVEKLPGITELPVYPLHCPFIARWLPV